MNFNPQSLTLKDDTTLHCTQGQAVLRMGMRCMWIAIKLEQIAEKEERGRKRGGKKKE